MGLLLFFEETECFDVFGHREHIEERDLFSLVAMFFDQKAVFFQAVWITG